MNPLLMIAATQGGGAVPLVAGPELWPQPAFAASTGLTTTLSSVTGGAWVTDASASVARVAVTAPPTISAGQKYQYSITIASNPGNDAVSLQISNTVSLTDGSAPVTGTFTGTITVIGSTQVMRISDTDNGGALHITACSIKLLS